MSNRKRIKLEEVEMELSLSQIETVFDDARIYGFWPWLNRYRRLGFPVLFKLFKIEDEWPSGIEYAENVDLEEPDNEDEREERNLEKLLPVLKDAFSKQIKKRSRLETYYTFDHAIELISAAKNIIVLTGRSIWAY